MPDSTTQTSGKMKVRIWSDIRCPFCYIGKRKFEMALAQFPQRDGVEVHWHSFQLDPGLKTQPDVHSYDYLADIKGITREQTVSMHHRVEQIGEEVGIRFNFEKTIVANSFNGHRLIQLAKSRGLADDAEEQLFKAHFTDGKNIDDASTLREIGISLGLSESDVESAITGTLFSDEVKEDQIAAQSLGIRGVPFFVLNEKFAVSGAQDPQLFFQALNQAWNDFSKSPVV